MEVSLPQSSPYPFGMDCNKLADELIILAEKIRRGDCNPQGLTEMVVAKRDMYTTKRVIISFVEKNKK